MQLGWIDFSKEDRQKALDVINLLSEQGAVDELGIGIIRDAFANYFFPGTSTIQTRAKYFLIVPYVLREAVDGRYGKDVNRVLRAIDSAEKDFPNMAADRYEQNDQFFRKLFDDPDMMRQVMETVGSVLYERLKKKYIFDPKSGVIEEATPETYVEDTYLTKK